MVTSKESDFALNDAQYAAVSADAGPMLVVAGAGTGKTRVIVERILHLTERGIPANNILALTFTEKAAGEMLDRINSSRAGLTLDATIATFNGFGSDLLEQYGSQWGLGTLRLLGETGQLVFLREHFDEFELEYFAPVSRPEGQLELLASYVSQLKQQVILPETYRAYAAALSATTEDERLERQKHQELASFFERYVELCRRSGAIDYDDQIYTTIALLKARPNILHELQTRYTHILVDEFQDTNPMQSMLIDMLAGKTQNVTLVGDDDQSIYGWRGATLANILDFKQRFPAAKDVTLIENYRSTQAILDAAYRLIQGNNPDRLEVINNLDKRLHAQTNEGPPPQAHHFSSFDAELTWISNDIARRLKSGQEPGSIAVLARRNQGVRKIHEMLELQGIAHAVAGLSNNIYEESAVKQLIEALKTVGDPLDELALYHTLIGPMFNINPTTLANAAAHARREHTQLHDLLDAVEDKDLQSALASIRSWRTHSHEQTVGALAYQIITDTGWKQQLYEEAEHDETIFRQVQALSKYFKTLKEFEKIADVASVQSYLINLATLKSAGSGFEDASLDISDTLVNVLSVHRAKGLEWDTVYIIDCTEGSFPMRNFGGGLQIPPELKANQTAADAHMAEERRLMYVASTRARHELILTHSDHHDSNMMRKPSRFLGELLGDVASTHEVDETQTELELFAPQTAENTIHLPSAMVQDDKIVLSVSQIDCYLRCPQDFYYLYVLQMPVTGDPSLQYGTAVHKAIEQIFRSLIAHNLPSLDALLQTLREALPMSGYLTARSRDRAHAQAERTVRSLYERLPQEAQPIEIEKPFRAIIPDSRLEIIGRIDAVYKLDAGIEIRDFKTGTAVTTAQKAKSRATASNQLALYALAWQLLYDEMAALLTLDFVETGQVGSVKKQPKSLETLLAKLQEMEVQLRGGRYLAGKDHTYCKHPY